MKSILDIVNREPKPAPWSEGDNIPWNDPDFSERMLAEHLSQDHDLASRRSETIDQHVGWVFSDVLHSKPATLLDLGCGPGFYASRLAKLGCTCVGIDFSPASIRHAVENAAAEDLSCTFHHADIRDTDFGDGFNLVMLTYGQFNVFPRERGSEILEKAYRALVPGGILLLELQSYELIQQNAEQPPTWYTAPSGLFSAEPHLVLQENFWHEDDRASTTRFSVIDAQTNNVDHYALSNEAYTQEELLDALQKVGFGEVEAFPSLSGHPVEESEDLPVVVARK